MTCARSTFGNFQIYSPVDPSMGKTTRRRKIATDYDGRNEIEAEYDWDDPVDMFLGVIRKDD